MPPLPLKECVCVCVCPMPSASRSRMRGTSLIRNTHPPINRKECEKQVRRPMPPAFQRARERNRERERVCVCERERAREVLTPPCVLLLALGTNTAPALDRKSPISRYAVSTPPDPVLKKESLLKL